MVAWVEPAIAWVGSEVAWAQTHWDTPAEVSEPAVPLRVVEPLAEAPLQAELVERPGVRSQLLRLEKQEARLHLHILELGVVELHSLSVHQQERRHLCSPVV